MSKKALGKGLSALLGNPHDPSADNANRGHIGESIRNVLLDEIFPSPLQPRKEFTTENLAELTASIREHGIIQPLIVRASGAKWELIAGERRWRAARQVGLATVPIIVRQASDRDVLEMALIENLQRADLNPMEEAHAFDQLARDFGLRQEDIAQKIGKNRATVANTMRLLALDEGVQNMLIDGSISAGHAKALLGLKTHDEQRVCASDIMKHGLTVRQAEQLINRQIRPNPSPKPELEPNITAALNSAEHRLREHLGTRVKIHHQPKHGKLEIEYFGTDDLNRLLTLIGLQEEPIK